MNLELNPLPDGRQSQLDDMLGDPWLAKKVDRNRRLAEHSQWLEQNAPAVFSSPPPGGASAFLDIGCGPGESLEIARANCWDAVGIDACAGDGGMGYDWLLFCEIRWEQQELDVIQVDSLVRWLSTPRDCEAFAIIVCRGAIEQIFSAYMDGVPHHVHHDAKRMRWRIEDKLVRQHIRRFAHWTAKLLATGGRLAVHFNGSQNHDDAAEVWRAAWVEAGLAQVPTGDERLMVWDKAKSRKWEARMDATHREHGEARLHHADSRGEVDVSDSEWDELKVPPMEEE